MIPVARSRADKVREKLEARGRDGLSERQRAVAYYRDGTVSKKPTFAKYKSQIAKDELNEIFHKKCAYCESRYAHVTPMDVEHFRPKNGYLDPSGKLVQPGYYWLAAEWENLLPSCVDCNRARKQKKISATGAHSSSTAGKENHFPLAPGSPRASQPDEHEDETALLLDPCSDDLPNRHLQFTDLGYVMAHPGKTEKDLPKGENTIEVCALDRADLVAERLSWLKRLKSEMKRACEGEKSARKYPEDTDFPAQIADSLGTLKVLSGPGEPYTAMSVDLIRRFNRIRNAVKRYWSAVDALTASPDDAALENDLTRRTRSLKNYLKPGRPDANLAREIMEWCGLKDQLPP